MHGRRGFKYVVTGGLSTSTVGVMLFRALPEGSCREVVVARSPFAVNVRDASAYVSVRELITVLASGEQTAGAFGLMESVFGEGAEPPLHVHHREDESFFVLEASSPCASVTTRSMRPLDLSSSAHEMSRTC